MVNTRLGHVAYMKIGVRISTFMKFCEDFNLDLASNIKLDNRNSIDKNSYLENNFMYFLLENKTFIIQYQLDRYSDKSLEIICNKIGRSEHEVRKYFEKINYIVKKGYPYRYISSYKIDYDLGRKYFKFIKYDPNHFYEGNYEYRRRLIEQKTSI